MERQLTPRTEFGILFVTLGRKWLQAVNDQLQRSGLTDASWAPLIRLDIDGDNITQTELSARVALDTSSLVRLLDLLEARGFVQRLADPQDRRAKRIILTPAGRAEIAKIRERIDAIEADLLRHIGDEEIAQSLKVMRLLAAEFVKGDTP